MQREGKSRKNSSKIMNMYSIDEVIFELNSAYL